MKYLYTHVIRLMSAIAITTSFAGTLSVTMANSQSDAQQNGATMEALPLLTIPKLERAPELTGTLEDEPWASAAATTGFVRLDGALTSQQTQIYVGFDDTHLFVAFRATRDGRFGMGEAEGDVHYGPDTEGLEIWLVPPGGDEYYQVVLVPAGGVLDISKSQGRSWKSGSRYESRVEDSGETMGGGILTFGRTTWTGEVAIPFASMGVDVPQDGEEWRINFGRAFTAAEAERTTADWTTWAPLTWNFSDVDQFGIARFDRSGAKLFRLESLGNIGTGDLNVSGEAGQAVDVAITVSPADDKQESALERNVSGVFALQETIRGTAAADMMLQINARDGGDLVARQAIPFVYRAPLDLQVKPFLSSNRLDVAVDVSRVMGDTEGATVRVGLYARGEAEAVAEAEAQQNVGSPGEPLSLRIDISDLEPGKYSVQGNMVDPQGDQLAVAQADVVIPEPFEWEQNTLGISTHVPPPWTPLSVKDNEVEVSQRRYVLQDSGLPAQVVSLDREMLSRPAVLRASIGGHVLDWQFRPLEEVSRNDREVVWRVAGTAGNLSLEGTVTVEFDGFALWDVTLTSQQAMRLDHLSLHFPMRREVALFARGDGIAGARTTNLLRDRYSEDPHWDDMVILGRRTEVDPMMSSWMFSRTGWAWPEEQLTQLWVGDDRIGLSLMTETHENVHGSRYADFHRRGDEILMQVNLISEPTMLREPLTYQYAYQAMPLKPEPDDPRRWRAAFIGDENEGTYNLHYRSQDQQAFLDRLFMGMSYYTLDKEGYPERRAPELSLPGLELFRQHGVNIVPNLWYAAIATDVPAYEYYKHEWEAHPAFGWGQGNSPRVVVACMRTSLVDHQVWVVDGLVNRLGYDGFYSDAGATFCHNESHGCGFRDGDGRLRPTQSLFATREFLKRAYTVLKEGEKERVHFAHTGEGAAIGGFADVRTQGEEWTLENEQQYRRMSPAFFRARYASNEYGTPLTFYAYHQYEWRAAIYGEPVSLDEILMMSLPHRVMPTIGDGRGRAEIPPVWDAFEDWWTSSQFIPYWRDDAPVTTEAPERILASTFLKNGKALVVVSNWQYDAATARVRLDWKKLGLDPDRVKIVSFKPGEEPQAVPVQGRLSIELDARDYRLLVISAEDD